MKKQYTITFVILVFLCAGYVAFLHFFINKSQPTVTPSDLTSSIVATSTKNAVIPLNTVLIADTQSLQELGLGKRDSLSQDTGMLFVFDHSDFYYFWMKDMKFPIDMIWLDENFKVLHVEKDISPETYPKTFGAAVKSSFVLEVSAKIAEKNNYTEGSTLTFLKGYLHMK